MEGPIQAVKLYDEYGIAALFLFLGLFAAVLLYKVLQTTSKEKTAQIERVTTALVENTRAMEETTEALKEMGKNTDRLFQFLKVKEGVEKFRRREGDERNDSAH